jgi:hypothetical protein
VFQEDSAFANVESQLERTSPLGNDERSFTVRGRNSGSCNVGV